MIAFRTLLAALFLFAALPALAQSPVKLCIPVTTSANSCQVITAAFPLPVTSTASASSVNFTPVAAATATATRGTLLGGQYDSTQKTLTNGQQAAASFSARGALFVAVGADGFAVTNAGTFATQSAVTAASGSFVSGSQPIGITPTDRTVTSATGASQTVMSANTSRKSLMIENTGSSNCGVNPTGGTAVIGGAGTFTVAPFGVYSPRVPSLASITAICTAGQPLYAEES